jgi:hemerythrin-like metal-binding protein
MRDIVWDKILSVGVDEIDEDHRKLVSIFNTLNHAVSEGDSTEYLAAVLEELINCTVWHFSHEERLMLKYGYDQAAEHKDEHRELIDSAKALRDEILQSGGVVTESHIEYLERWLTEHILTSDMRLGDRLYQAM